MTRSRRILAALAGGACVAALTGTASARPTVGLDQGASAAGALPPVKHLFIINFENKGFTRTWGPTSKAPYLSKTLRAKGVLLSNYYATAHNSQPNYIAQISGQGPNRKM